MGSLQFESRSSSCAMGASFSPSMTREEVPFRSGGGATPAAPLLLFPLGLKTDFEEVAPLLLLHVVSGPSLEERLSEEKSQKKERLSLAPESIDI